MTGITNDGAAGTSSARGGDERRPAPDLPTQRYPRDRPSLLEVVVRLDESDESLDQVVTAAREARARGAVLRLLATHDPEHAGSRVARERVARRLALGAEVARAVSPGLEVRVTAPGDERVR